MGWLRELMRSASPPLDGYGELARRALAHSEWPKDTQPQARSLAALFSKLDRGIELEWLADRAAAQRTLGLILGCPLEVIQRPLEPLADPQNTANRLRLADLPYGRPLALEDENLPPGIPVEVQQPMSWGRLWWRAPSGSGRSLTGQWLRARGLASFYSARRWQDVAARLPTSGPIFLELERPEDLALIDRGLEGARVCVATPARPPPSSVAAWQLVESPTPGAMLGPLLTWIEDRLPRDGAFEAEAASAWLREPVSAGMLPTWGALLGAAGLLDVRSLREAQGLTLSQLAERFVNERLEEASQKGSAEAQWLKRFGFEVVVKLAEGVLTTRDEAWEVARTLDEWMELIPEEYRQSVDTEWVRWSLTRSGGHATVRELEKALRNVPPGAYRLVRALTDAGLLASRGSPLELTLQPEFLKHTALVQARANLLNQGSPFGWGEALLRPHAAPSLLEALYERLIEDDFRLVDNLFELDLGSQPALVAATEATFVGLGLRVLSGAEVPLDQLRSIWNEQLGWLVELPGKLPSPRLCCFEPSSSFCALSNRAVWGLAALSLSEALGSKEGASHPVLRPWTTKIRAPLLGQLLDEIFEVVARPEVASYAWAVDAFALAGRLDVQLAESSEPSAVHPLARPARLVRSLLEGEVDGAGLDGFGQHPLELGALRAECELQRLAWPRMAHALWKAWQDAGCREQQDGLFAPDSSNTEALWPHLPADVFESVWSRWAERAEVWPHACFGRVQWQAFVSCWRRRWLSAASPARFVSAFEAMELEWLERAVREADLLHAPARQGSVLVGVLWRRFPAWTLALLVEKIDQGDAVAIALLVDAATRDHDPQIVRALSENLSKKSAPRAALDEARRWLQGKVSERAPAWRQAYGLLADLEQRRARSERARGN